MRIVVIDGQGGNIGKQISKIIIERFPEIDLMVIGTNSAATANMLKSGAKTGATGENAVLVACRKADIIVGPIGIVIADSLAGEITPAMAIAVAQSNAKRIMIPFNHCDNIIVGVNDYTVSKLLCCTIEEIEKELKK